MDLPRQSWTEAEGTRAEIEQEAMRRLAPELEWRTDLTWQGHSGLKGWEGLAPIWAAARAMPEGVNGLLGADRLRLQVICRESFPMSAPVLVPLDPEVPPDRRTQHRWHVNGDGSLCLMQAADDWDPSEPAAQLVAKATGWFIEYRLLEAGLIEAMTLRGIYEDASLDSVIEGLA